MKYTMEYAVKLYRRKFLSHKDGVLIRNRQAIIPWLTWERQHTTTVPPARRALLAN